MAISIALVFLLSTVAYALPSDTIVIGNKAFTIDTLFNPQFSQAIQDALDDSDGESLFFNMDGYTEGFVNLFDIDQPMTEEQKADLKNIVLTKEDGTTETYANFDDEEPVEETTALVVKSVSAINAKTLEVTFNTAVAEEDQAEATFDVKRGTIATTVEATWAEDGKSVELARATNLIAGTYTVTVGGLEFAEGANVGTVEVETQKIASLEITTENVVRDGAARLDYKVYDQYGEELTRNANVFNWTVVNTTDITRLAEPNPTGVAYLEIDTDGSDTTTNGVAVATNVGDVLRVTGILASDPTVKVVKEVTVSNVFVESFELGEVVLPEGETRLNLNAGAAYDVEVSYTASTNYGDDVKLAAGTGATIDGITFISSNTTLITLANTAVNAEGKLTLEVAQNQSGKATITALNNNTGDTSSIQLEVFAAKEANTAEFGESMIIDGDATTRKLPVTFFDQFGDEMAANAVTNLDLTTVGSVFNVAVSGAGTLTVGNVSADGKDITFSAATKGTYTLTLTNKNTGAQSSTTVEVLEERLPNELVVATTPTTTIVATESTTVKFEVIDQYGKKMTADKAGYEVKVTKESGADTKLTAPLAVLGANGSGLAISAAVADITITAGAAATTETVTFTLQKTDGTAIDSQAFNITIVADAADFNVTTDEEEYTAGDDIVVTIKAEDGNGDFYNKYNETQTATIELRGATAPNVTKTYIRTLNFVNGVATATVPATLADDIDVRVSFGGSDYDMGADHTSGDIEVEVAEASKFVLAGANTAATLDVTLKDNYGNTITDFAGDKVLNVTHPASADRTGATPIDAEGNVVVNFTAGEGTITFGANLPDGDYTVTFDGYTGTLTVE